jgi:hypothetical protein
VVNIDMTDVFDDYICRNIGIKDSTGGIIAVPMGWALRALRKNFLRIKAGLVEESFIRKIFDSLRARSQRVSGRSQE